MKTKLILLFCFTQITLWPQSAAFEMSEWYSKGEFEKVIELGRTAFQNTPNDPHVNMLLGRALADSGAFEAALVFLENGATIEKGNMPSTIAWSLAYMGHCHLLMKDTVQSLKYLNQAKDLRATSNVERYIDQRLDWINMQQQFSNWTKIETKNIRFYFENPSVVGDLQAYATKRQIAFDNILDFFGDFPDQKLDMYIWEDRAAAKKALGRPVGFASAKYLTIHAHRRQSLGHEPAHVIVHWSILPKRRVRFINEGVAVFFDQNKVDRLAEARKANTDKKFSVEKMWKKGKRYKERELYPIAGAFIQFLSENGTPQQLKALLKEQTLDAAEDIYGQNFELMLKAFDQLVNGY
jgi:hypothetical protein